MASCDLSIFFATPIRRLRRHLPRKGEGSGACYKYRVPRVAARASIAVICASDLRNEEASGVVTFITTWILPLPPPEATPRRPSLVG